MKTCVVMVACAAGAAGAQPLVSHFDGSAEGWTIETRTSPAAAFSLVGTYTPDHVGAGGDPNGYISELDPDDQWSFFRAPSSWHGDRSAFSMRRLRYSTRTDTANYPDGRLVILFGDNGVRLSHDAGLPPVGVWTRRDVPLEAGSWFVGTNGSGTLATQVQIDAVLGDLEGLFIGLEFGGDLAEERVDLDRVGFGVCAADLNIDGVLDFFDVQMFLGAFAGGDDAGDWNADGVFDFFDVQSFLNDYSAGCP